MCAVWRYDKRAVNGQSAPVVYFATMLQALPPLLMGRRDGKVSGEGGNGEGEEDASSTMATATLEEEEALRVANYACACLNAVGFQDGPAHIEVKWPRQDVRASSTANDIAGIAGDTAYSTEKEVLSPLEETGPAIVEINARWHAANTAPLVEACLGGQEGKATSAIDATVFAVLASAAPGGDGVTTIADGTTAAAATERTPSFDDQSMSLNPRIQEAALLEAVAACWHAIPSR